LYFFAASKCSLYLLLEAELQSATRSAFTKNSNLYTATAYNSSVPLLLEATLQSATRSAFTAT